MSASRSGSAQINAELELSSVQETVTVTGESPLIDTKATGTKTSFDLESLQGLPTARDPWVMLEKTPGITMDRANVGGSQSGQQSGYISRGSSTGNNKWSIDGVDVTDMSATGSSPMYYDFDMLEEMQVTTGGADASQQTGGVGINLVTRGGTDRFKGSGRFLVTDDAFQADNINDELRAQGAGSGSPIQNIQDYGFEVGGPIKRGKAWFWGSYGTQDIKVGVVGFYKDTPTCRPTPPTDTQGLRDCLETDLTTLDNYNWKVTVAPFESNRFGLQNTWGGKVRNARDASDTRPIETTYRQKNTDSRYGTFGWNSGPVPIWKASDQHVFSDRFLVDAQWAHVGNNFTLDFHDDSLYDVQPKFETSTGKVRALVPAVGILAADQQLRPHLELLPAELPRRRPRVQGWPPLEERPLDQPEPSRRQRVRPLHERRAELGRPVARRQFGLAPRHLGVLRAGQLHGPALHVEPRPAVRHPGRRGAGGGGGGEPASANDPAGGQLPRCGRQRDLEEPLAAPGHDLRPERHRPHGAQQLVRHLLRPDGARTAVRRAGGHRRGLRALSLGRHQRRRLRAGRRGEHLGAVAQPQQRVQPRQPVELPVAGHGGPEHRERSHLRGHRRHRPPDHERPCRRRQLHLAQVRQLQLAGPRRPDERRLRAGATTRRPPARPPRAASRSPTSSRRSRFRRSSSAPTFPTARATSTASS